MQYLRHATGPGLILRKVDRSRSLKNDRRPTIRPSRGRPMNITLNGALQFLGFCIAMLLATGVLVLAGLNERNSSPDSLASISHATKDSR